MINSYNTSAVHEMVFAFFRALNEGFVPQRPASRPVPFIIMEDIPDYEGHYAATKDGKIWSYKGGIFLKFGSTHGYAAKGTRLTVGGYIWKYSAVNQLIKANKKLGK